MGKNREWKVTRNGKLWTDRFDTEKEAIEYMEKCVEEDGADYEVLEMTADEIVEYDMVGKMRKKF